MANDIVFKTKAFGGFNKEEVMDFVNKILAEKSELEKRNAELSAKFAQANAETLEYKKLADDALEAKTGLLNANSKIAELESAVSSKDDEIAKLTNQINELNAKLNEAVITDDIQAEIDSLRAENATLKIENDKKRDLERQVGAAMLDARLHSEELIEEAKEKANAVTKSVYAAIGETALKIDDLSGGIGEIARNFTKSVEEVELRIKALTGDMSKTAQLLIADTGYVSENNEKNNEIEYDFSTGADFVEEQITINPSDYDVEPSIEISSEDYNTEE